MYNQSTLFERIIAALSYITMGFAGFIWLIITIIARIEFKPFMQYHVFQSIFISIAYFLLSVLCGFIVNILSLIPFINKLTAQIVFLLNSPVFGNYSLIQTIVYLIILYLAVHAFFGNLGRLPYISDIIDQNIGRK